MKSRLTIARKHIKMATPSGQSVPFWILQTTELELNVPPFALTPAGMRITTIARPIMFSVEPTELYLAIQRVGILEIQAWMSMMNTVRRKVW